MAARRGGERIEEAVYGDGLARKDAADLHEKPTVPRVTPPPEFVERVAGMAVIAHDGQSGLLPQQAGNADIHDLPAGRAAWWARIGSCEKSRLVEGMDNDMTEIGSSVRRGLELDVRRAAHERDQLQETVAHEICIARSRPGAVDHSELAQRTDEGIARARRPGIHGMEKKARGGHGHSLSGTAVRREG